MNNEMKFTEDIAMMCGLKEAVLATFLYNLIAKDDDVMYRYGRLWSRISQKSISVHLPFMSVYSISRAARKLEEKGIIAIDEYNASRFDHTHSYSFTEFGDEIMSDTGCF